MRIFEAHLQDGACAVVEPVIRRRVRVNNVAGLHLRAAAEIVKLVRRFQAEIILEYQGEQANAESLLSITCLGAPCGARLPVYGTGPEAVQALDALAELFADGFGEGSEPYVHPIRSKLTQRA